VRGSVGEDGEGEEKERDKGGEIPQHDKTGGALGKEERAAVVLTIRKRQGKNLTISSMSIRRLQFRRSSLRL
jgi:hypothetical protein